MRNVWKRRAMYVVKVIIVFGIIIIIHTFLHILYSNWKNYILIDYSKFYDLFDRSIQNDMERILPVAQKIKSKPLLVTFINNAYLPFLLSWLCNTKDMNIHKQVLIVTTDHETKDKIGTLWPDVNAVTISMENSYGDQIFSHVGYVKIMIRRSRIILDLLQNRYQIFLFEADCLWLKNPLNYLKRFTGYDLIVGKITDRPEITGGLMYLYPSVNTVSTFRELNRKLTLLGHKIRNRPLGQFVSATDNDQMYLSGLVRQNFSGLHTKILFSADFADGMWYCLSKVERNKSYPYLINNNFVLGNRRKIARAKMWEHWFVTEDNTCLSEHVHKVVDGWQNYKYEPTNPALYSPCKEE